MFKNYLKTAWRNLSKHGIYSVINILGLTLGITSCLVIFLVVQYELNYDQFNSKADRIYRVTLNALDYNPSVSMAVVPALRNDFPELEEVSQVWYQRSGLVTIADVKYEEKNWAYADQYFPSIFDYQWLEGNPKTALAEPNEMVLTESIAHKYFGDKEAMGQIIQLENQYSLKVTGVIKDVPGNTHLPFNFLVSFETVRKEREKVGALSNFYWIGDGCFVYIVTPKNLSGQWLQSRMHSFIEKNWGANIAKEARLLIQPLGDIHFDQRYLNTISYNTTSRETYYALAAIALLIIIIASINFINLATAQAMRRAREVGIRKVMGSTRSQLIGQFLGETTLMVLISLFLGLVVTTLSLGKLATWLGIKIGPGQLLQPSIALMMFLVTVSIILFAGLYPAFVQSSFKPVESLKSRPTLNIGGMTLRKSLVAIQFAISQIMIIGTLVVGYQMDFFENKNLGFNKEAVISFVVPDQGKTELLRQQLRDNPGVQELSFSSGAPVLNSSFCDFNSPEAGITKGDVTEVKFIDEAYTDMFELKMLAGDKVRRIETSPNDTAFNVVVNETMIHKLGIHDPQKAIGKHLNFYGNWVATIQGVVRDFQSESKHKKIRPCILLYRPDNFYMASVRIRPANMNKTIATIGNSWSRLFPEGLFSYEFLNDHIAAWYQQEQKEYTAFKLFSCIAILIGCLGLYGLVAFAAAQRTKEVAIRKVLGASLRNIIFLFSKEFIILIALAFVIAAPLAYFIMHNWLESFAYRITIGANLFMIAILSSFVIAACTIAYQALKAGRANPVQTLRSE